MLARPYILVLTSHGESHVKMALWCRAEFAPVGWDVVDGIEFARSVDEAIGKTELNFVRRGFHTDDVREMFDVDDQTGGSAAPPTPAGEPTPQTPARLRRDLPIETLDWFYVPDEEDAPVLDYDDDDLEPREKEEYARVSEELLTTEQNMAAWLAREEDEARILRRWDQAEDALFVQDLIYENGLMAFSEEVMVAFRRSQCVALCVWTYGSEGVREDVEIVLRWKKENGRWTPAEKKRLSVWIADLIEEKGSQLAGYMSAVRSLQERLVRKDKATPFAPGRPVFEDEDGMREIVASAVEAAAAFAVEEWVRGEKDESEE